MEISRLRCSPPNDSFGRLRLRAVTENGARALRSGGRRAGAERKDRAERTAQRRPECSGAQPRKGQRVAKFPIQSEHERSAAHRPPPEQIGLHFGMTRHGWSAGYGTILSWLIRQAVSVSSVAIAFHGTELALPFWFWKSLPAEELQPSLYKTSSLPCGRAMTL